MTELGTHNTKGVLIDTTKVRIFLVMGVLRRSNKSLRNRVIVNFYPNVDQARLLACLMTMPPRLWPTNIIGRDYLRINAWYIARHSAVHDSPERRRRAIFYWRCLRSSLLHVQKCWLGWIRRRSSRHLNRNPML